MERKDIARLMLDSKLFAGFSVSECRELETQLQPQIREYLPQQVILDEGQKVRNIGIVVRGRFACTKFYYTGNNHIVSILMPKELVGLDALFTTSRKSPVMVAAQARTEMLVFDAEDLLSDRVLSAEQQIRVMKNLLRLLGDNGVRQMYKIEILSKRSLRERIKTYFSIMAEKRQSDSFAIQMSQEQLSQFLCVNRSALSSELNKMAREGLIAFRKDRYTILREHPAWKKKKQ